MKRFVFLLLLISYPAYAQEMFFREKNVATKLRVFLVQSDGVSAATGVTCQTGDARIIVGNATSSVNMASCFTEHERGWYEVTLSQTETNGNDIRITLQDQDGPVWLAKGILVETTGATGSGARHEDKGVDVTKVGGNAVTTADDFKTDVSGLSTFNAVTDEVKADVTKVNTIAVSSPNDLKATVTGLSTFDPTTDEVKSDIQKVRGGTVTSVNDFKGSGGGGGTGTWEQRRD